MNIHYAVVFIFLYTHCITIRGFVRDLYVASTFSERSFFEKSTSRISFLQFRSLKQFHSRIMVHLSPRNAYFIIQQTDIPPNLLKGLQYTCIQKKTDLFFNKKVHTHTHTDSNKLFKLEIDNICFEIFVSMISHFKGP